MPTRRQLYFQIKQISFLAPKPICNHYKFLHAIDDHNNQHCVRISLEGTWATGQQGNRVLAFFLPITEMDMSCSWFCQMTTQSYTSVIQTLFAKALTYNEYIMPSNISKKRLNKQLRLDCLHDLT